jgi:C-terminal processing protease CtpA/Prc
MKLQNKRNIFILLSFLFIGLISPGCEEEKVEPPEEKNSTDINEAFYNLMKEWYLWYDQIPDIDPGNYDNPDAILNEIKVDKDRWSYITTVEQFEQYYQEGAYIGYGYGQKWDKDNNLRITFVFDDSPLKKKNIHRGWIIREINGTKINPSVDLSSILGADEVGVSNNFLLESPEGNTVDTSFAKEKISMNTVLHSSVIEHNGNKTGYLVINSFIEKTSDELYEAFSKFSSQNISNIVIDLRYNGGGMLSKARETADYVIGNENLGKIFTQIMHNDKKEDENNQYKFKEDSLKLSWNFPALYFITTQGTASASEALINGMEPFNTVHIIGQNSHGKPVGMYAFYDNQEKYAFLPVCFRVANANEESDYYTGLGVDMEATDDITVPFGSNEEDCLYQALYHIENGSFDRKKSVFRSPYNKVEYRSIKDFIGAQ